MRAPKQLVYIVMLLRIYESGGACPDTLDAISTRTKLNKRVVSGALDELFRETRLVRESDGIANPKATKVIAESRELFKKRKIASQKAGLASAEKRKEKQGNDATSRSTDEPQTSTHLHLHRQDSLFPNGNSAPPKVPKSNPKVPKSKIPSALEIERKGFFDRGKQVLGDGAGGFLQKLLALKHGNIALARAAVEQASTMDNPREYIGGILRGGSNGKTGNSDFKSWLLGTCGSAPTRYRGETR